MTHQAFSTFHVQQRPPVTRDLMKAVIHESRFRLLVDIPDDQLPRTDPTAGTDLQYRQFDIPFDGLVDGERQYRFHGTMEKKGKEKAAYSDKFSTNSSTETPTENSGRRLTSPNAVERSAKGDEAVEKSDKAAKASGSSAEAAESSGMVVEIQENKGRTAKNSRDGAEAVAFNAAATVRQKSSDNLKGIHMALGHKQLNEHGLNEMDLSAGPRGVKESLNGLAHLTTQKEGEAPTGPCEKQ